MFSLFVRRDGLIEPPSIGTFDAHCHILPGIDDGPSTLDGSVDIARILVEMGIKEVVATPHIISDLYPNTTGGIRTAVGELNEELSNNDIPLMVHPGAEYYAELAFIESIRKGDILPFGEKNYVLFETPVETPPMFLEDIVYHLKSNAYTPLLAHVERYPYLQKDAALLEKLRALGVHFQVNHPSFSLDRTSRTGEMARRLYVKGYVDVLGTDMHRATPIQPVREVPARRSFRLLRQR